MEQVIMLSRDEDIANARLPFRIAPSVTDLTVKLGSIVNLNYFVEALQANDSIIHIRIKHSPCQDPINPIFAALSASNSLRELTVECFSKELITVVGSHIEYSPIKTLNIEGYDVEALNSLSFFEGLQINSTLTCITFKSTPSSLRDLQKLNACFKNILSALRKNITVNSVVVKSIPLNAVPKELKKEHGLEISPSDRLLTATESLYFAIFIERNAVPRRVAESLQLSNRDPSQSNKAVETVPEVKQVNNRNEFENVVPVLVHSAQVEQYLRNKNYEALRQYIESHCTQCILQELYPDDLDLHAKTIADTISARIVQEKLDKNRKITTKLRSDKTELEAVHKQVATEKEELTRRLAELEEKSEKLNGSINEISRELTDRAIAQENLEVNLMLFQVSREKNEPELKKWQEKLQTDLNSWTCEDISFLLKEIGLGKFSQIFLQNQIDGEVLQGLDTNDMTTTLGLPFKESKKLQMYLFLLQHRHDIYSVPTVVLNWSNEAVCNWLGEKNFLNLIQVFKQENITGAELVFLEKADLTNKLKIQGLGTTVKLQNEILKLKEKVIAELTAQKLDASETTL